MIDCRDGRCVLKGPVTFGNVVSLLARGKELLTAPEVTVDLTGVTDVDSSAISLLLEWRREAARNGRRIRFLGLPENLRSLARLYGVTDLISAQ